MNLTIGEPIEDALEAARDLLEMDMAFIAETRGGEQAYLFVAGSAESFGACVGVADRLEGTYSELMLEGRLGDGIVADARRDPRVRDLPITERVRIGSYIGTPVTLSDGAVFGTLCCLSHGPRPGLGERDGRTLRLVAGLIAAQLERARLTVHHRRQLISGTVRALLAALAARDGYTEEHSLAVVEVALQVGRELGLGEAELSDLENVALLHDIGKIGIPDHILRKPEALTDGEWAVMRRHPGVGATLVASIDPLAHLAPAIRAEHERWDGCGYPDGLRGDDIPLTSRIVFVCDALHAMTSDRPYRRAMRLTDATAELRANAGSQFCPRVVDAALGVVDAQRAARVIKHDARVGARP